MALKVGIAGATGRMGRLVVAAVAEAPDFEPGWLFSPGHGGEKVVGHPVISDRDELGPVDVVVEFTTPAVVMDNLATWRRRGFHAVVGTSGFDASRLEDVRRLWTGASGNCLIVPNFSIGAVLMMQFAQTAARMLPAAEIVELHHAGKLDSPSGTAQSTAESMADVRPAVRSPSSDPSPSRGADISGVRVHSIRLPGLVAHQEVLFGAEGELLTIRHDTTDRRSFMNGVLLAVRSVHSLEPVSVGLGQLLVESKSDPLDGLRDDQPE